MHPISGVAVTTSDKVGAFGDCREVVNKNDLEHLLLRFSCLCVQSELRHRVDGMI